MTFHMPPSSHPINLQHKPLPHYLWLTSRMYNNVCDSLPLLHTPCRNLIFIVIVCDLRVQPIRRYTHTHTHRANCLKTVMCYCPVSGRVSAFSDLNEPVSLPRGHKCSVNTRREDSDGSGFIISCYYRGELLYSIYWWLIVFQSNPPLPYPSSTRP